VLPNFRSKWIFSVVMVLSVVAWHPLSLFAMDPKFELDPKMLDKKLEEPLSHPPGRVAAHPVGASSRGSSYTVKPGDHLFRVLAREYGITGDRAEALIPDIKRLNKLSDIRRLKVGSTILIPPLEQGVGHKGGAVHKTATAKRPKKSVKSVRDSFPAAHQLRMVSVVRGGEGEVVEVARQVWGQLVPNAGEDRAPLDFNTANFSLSLDPAKYPVLPAADGGRILLDGGGTLPPLVKSLIQDKAPQVRIVSESSRNRKRFFNSLLAAAKFYSVEEDFNVYFGSDPKISVNADFKVEKTADNLLHQDIILLNVNENRRVMPGALVNFLASKGFRAIEATPAPIAAQGGEGHRLYQITGRDPQKIVDSLLEALSLPYDSSRSIELYGYEELGVKLEIKADRYFEENGQRIVVAMFNGDPVNYTIMRLLQTTGYRVIMLDARDNFRTITEKFLSTLHIPARYDGQDLWSARDTGYGVTMSGVMIHDKKNRGRNIFLTDRGMDSVVRELTEINGYSIVSN
jgi:hypothetical protein